MPKILLSYIRKSVLDDERTASPARQRAAILRVTPEGWVNHWYEDLDFSGQTSNRPEWQRLLSDLQTLDDVAGVGSESLSRLYRNRSEFEHLSKLILEMDKQLILANMPGASGRTAAGRLLLNIQADVDQFWAEQAAEHMRETLHTIVYEKHRHVGHNPFGCDRDPQTKHLVPSVRTYLYDPSTGQAYPAGAEAPLRCEVRHYHDALRALYDIHSDGRHSLQDTAADLAAAGWYFWGRDYQGPVPFTRQTVRSVLLRWQLYAGELPPSKYTPVKRNRNRPLLPGGHEPILPVELCYLVGAVLEKRRLVRQVYTNKSDYCYLLSGVLICARCGQRMGGQKTGRGRGNYYRHLYAKGECSERMAPAADLEKQVLDCLLELVQLEEIIQDVAEELRRLARLAIAEEMDTPLAELEGKRAEHNRLIDLRVKGLISEGEFIERDTPLRAEIERLEKPLTGGVSAGAVNDIEPIVWQVLSHIGELDRAEPILLKEIVHDLFERLAVQGRQIVRATPQTWAAPLFESLCWARAGPTDCIKLKTLTIIEWLNCGEFTAIY